MITNVEAVLVGTVALASMVFRCSGAVVHQVSLVNGANEVGDSGRFFSAHNELIFKSTN